MHVADFLLSEEFGEGKVWNYSTNEPQQVSEIALNIGKKKCYMIK